MPIIITTGCISFAMGRRVLNRHCGALPRAIHKPPQTPNLLLPLQRKDGVQINFSAVPHCDRYVVYRAAIPKISDSYLAAIDPRLKAVLFESPSESDTFLTSMLMKSIQLTAQSQTGMSSLSAVSRFKTLNYTAGSLSERLELVPGDRRLDIYQRIMKDFGSLALETQGSFS